MKIETKFMLAEYGFFIVVLLLSIGFIGGKMYHISTLKRITYHTEINHCDETIKQYTITDCLDTYPLTYDRDKFGPINKLKCGIQVESIENVCGFKILTQKYQD